MKWTIALVLCGIGLVSADSWASDLQCTAAQISTFPGCLTIDMVDDSGVGYSCVCTVADPGKEKHAPVTLGNTESVPVVVQSLTGETVQTCRLVNIGGRLKLICS